MAVMAVGYMRMGVMQAGVMVPVAVRPPRIHGPVMLMVMMLIVRMAMLVRHFCVLVLMLVTFADVQPDADRHQDACRQEL